MNAKEIPPSLPVKRAYHVSPKDEKAEMLCIYYTE